MTATRPSPRRILTAPETKRATQALTPGHAETPLGPFAYGFASMYITIAVLLAGPAYTFDPYWWTITLAFPAAALMLAPRSHARRVVFDGPLMLLIAWIGLSVLWTFNEEFGLFSIRRDIPLWIAASLMGSLLPTKDVIAAIKRGVFIAIIITIVGLLLFPETRLNANDGIYVDDVPGWHGFFVHKNVLSPFIIFGLILTVHFESDRIRRSVSLAVLAVLLVGSDSATGISAALFIGALFVWFRFFHRSGAGRRSTAYVVSSIAVGLVGLMGAAASLSILTNAAGKDLTFSGRTYIWGGVINAIQDRPFLGYGVGGVFWDQQSNITRSIWRDVGFHIPHSHSGILDVWLNYGVVGVLLFAALFITGVAKGIRLIRRSPRTAEWLLTLLAAQLLMGLSENVFLGAWIVYIGLARGIAQRELNDLARLDAEANFEDVLDSRESEPAAPSPLRGPRRGNATPL